LDLAQTKSIRYKLATIQDNKQHFKLYSKWKQSLLQEDQVDQAQQVSEASKLSPPPGPGNVRQIPPLR
jgi:hypothetical protein